MVGSAERSITLTVLEFFFFRRYEGAVCLRPTDLKTTTIPSRDTGTCRYRCFFWSVELTPSDL